MACEIRRRLSWGAEITLQWMKMGQDWVLLLSGGDKPHIGCTVLAIPRPSLTGSGRGSSTASVLNVTGHKDDEICRWLAETMASAKGVTVVCSGGFHVDGITPVQIEEVMAAVKEMGAALADM